MVEKINLGENSLWKIKSNIHLIINEKITYLEEQLNIQENMKIEKYNDMNIIKNNIDDLKCTIEGLYKIKEQIR